MEYVSRTTAGGAPPPIFATAVSSAATIVSGPAPTTRVVGCAASMRPTMASRSGRPSDATGTSQHGGAVRWSSPSPFAVRDRHGDLQVGTAPAPRRARRRLRRRRRRRARRHPERAHDRSVGRAAEASEQPRRAVDEAEERHRAGEGGGRGGGEAAEAGGGGGDVASVERRRGRAPEQRPRGADEADERADDREALSRTRSEPIPPPPAPAVSGGGAAGSAYSARVARSVMVPRMAASRQGPANPAVASPTSVSTAAVRPPQASAKPNSEGEVTWISVRSHAKLVVSSSESRGSIAPSRISSFEVSRAMQTRRTWATSADVGRSSLRRAKRRTRATSGVRPAPPPTSRSGVPAAAASSSATSDGGGGKGPTTRSRRPVRSAMSADQFLSARL